MKLVHEHLGAVDYDTAWALQRRLHAERLAGRGRDTLLTLEHSPGVLTAGRRALDRNLRTSRDALEAEGVQVRDVERGGDWTWHGPGQLVAYPVLALKGWDLDVPAFVAGLESAMATIAQRALDRAGLELRAGRRCGYPGLWVLGDGFVKLGAVGVHVRRFVTLHGLALNLDPEPWGFARIVPCGLKEPTSSLARLIGSGERLPSVEQAGLELAELLPRLWRGELPAAPTI